MFKSQKKIIIEVRIKRLNEILSKLNALQATVMKLEFIDNLEDVKQFLSSNKASNHFFEMQDEKRQILLKSMIIIGQEKIISILISNNHITDEFISTLEQINTFYEPVHGLIAYQLKVLTLILEDLTEDSHLKINENRYIKPLKVDISKKSSSLHEFIRYGIENLGGMAEIYPVGGAGERLKLVDQKTEEPLPVAMLPFLGRDLLTGLIRDLEAKEFLAFKLTGKQIFTPVAMMTSGEKNNHEYIKNTCELSNWFKRGKDNFFLFSQAMVPVITETGDWLLSSLNQLMLKPGGHGVIWKLAKERGVFDWFKQHNRNKMLTRQINNPVAGVDGGLISFVGVGIKGKKAFGFSSCGRLVNASEGMDILIEKETDNGFEYKITNIEYTEFVKKGIEDKPECEGNQFSEFPANTNILFVDILEAEQAIEKIQVPGMLMNMKSTIPFIDNQGLLTKIKVGRLESTMQNIADEIVDIIPEKLNETDYGCLKSYLTYNERNKTIAVTKKSYNPDSFLETPESCFYIIQSNYHECFSVYCAVKMPPLRSPENYLKNGPSVLIDFHPAIGPFYSIIAQKFKGGKFLENSELQLEIAELDIENIELDGSLIIKANHVTGSLDNNHKLQYGKDLGKCTLKNVKIKNLGIDRNTENVYWKQDYNRLESLTITLHGDSEFIAENVTLDGHLNLEVMDGERLTVFLTDEKLQFKREKLDKNQVYWIYEFDDENQIVLKKSKEN